MKYQGHIINNHVIQTIQIPTVSSKYADELIKLKCSPELLATGYFPNFKEITESFGAYHAFRKYVISDQKELGDASTVVVVVGDGNTPRTGAVFAYRSAFTVISVDPRLKTTDTDVKRLVLFKDKIENKDFSYLRGTYNNIVLVNVHSHAKLHDSIKSVEKMFHTGCKFSIINIPCCLSPGQGDLSRADKDIEYEDWGITSPKRTVQIKQYITI